MKLLESQYTITRRKQSTYFIKETGKAPNATLRRHDFFLKPYIPPILCTIDNGNSHSTKITYIRQLTQPPPNFPNYVTTDTMEYLFHHPQGICTDVITGDPVKNYVYMLGILQTTADLRYWTKDVKSAKIIDGIRRGLKQKGFMKMIHQFQSGVTERWRGVRPLAEAMFLSVSGEDELTQNGASKVVLGLMSIFGLVKHLNAGDEDDMMVSDVVLGNNYQKRLLLRPQECLE